MMLQCSKPGKKVYTCDPVRLAPQWVEEASGFQAFRDKLVWWPLLSSCSMRHSSGLAQ